MIPVFSVEYIISNTITVLVIQIILIYGYTPEPY